MRHVSRAYRATFSALSEHHPLLIRGLALLFFLAGLVLCIRVL